jgi:hypothetical protein
MASRLVRAALVTLAVLISLTLRGLAAVGWAEERPAQPAQPPPAPQESAGIDEPWQAWWRSAREELFAGIALSAEQQQAIDAIVAEAAADRARARQLMGEVELAQREGDDARLARARAELRTLRPRLGPRWRIDAMGALLTQEQRAIFERQRRLRSDRLFAEQSRRQRRAGAAGSGSAPPPPQEPGPGASPARRVPEQR